jgi:hypothetical protein
MPRSSAPGDDVTVSVTVMVAPGFAGALQADKIANDIPPTLSARLPMTLGVLPISSERHHRPDAQVVMATL